MEQEFDKPFDSPAILVVGHQTDGKSALVEALMGFQFNHVGGGTKTRRPIAINMKYNASCVEPRCFLLRDESYGREEEMSLPDLQRYIESENQRLENDNGFWAKDIVVKIEYKYCPNLTIIDTPRSDRRRARAEAQQLSAGEPIRGESRARQDGAERLHHPLPGR